jgi:hypothetical protein
VKTSAALFVASDLLRLLGKRFRSFASFSPVSGIWAATDTNPATDEWLAASVITAARSVVQCEDALRGSPVLLEAIPRLLEDADFEAVLDKKVVRNHKSLLAHTPR